jgi:hypothetical protein
MIATITNVSSSSAYWQINMADFSLIFVRFLFFLDAFAKLRKSDSSLHHVCLSACLSVRPYAWNNLAHTGLIFMKYDL